MVVAKLHHSLCDGIGALALVAQLFDDEPSPPRTTRRRSSNQEPAPGWPWLLGRATLHAMRWPVEVVATSVELVGSVLRLRDTVEHMSAADLAAPLATPHPRSTVGSPRRARSPSATCPSTG